MLRARRLTAGGQRGEQEGCDTERGSSFYPDYTQYVDVRNMILFIDFLDLFPLRYY